MKETGDDGGDETDESKKYWMNDTSKSAQRMSRKDTNEVAE